MLAAENRIAERPAHPLEQRRAPQEREPLLAESVQVLGVQVRRHEPMVAGEDNLWLIRLRPHAGRAPSRERRELERSRPALGAVEQVLRGVAGQVGTRRAQKELCLASRQREVARPQLEQPPTHPQLIGDRALDPARDDDRRAFGDVLGQQRHDLERVGRREHVRVLDDEDAPVRGRERGRDARDDGAPERRLRRRERLERPAVDRRQPVDGGGQVLQQHDRIVVAPVERDPGELPVVARCPLRQQRRLPVTARCDDGHGARGQVGAQAVDEGST